MNGHSATAYRPIYQRLRGSALESVHHGAAAVVEPGGELQAWYGSPRTSTYLRSSAKPLQAIPLVELGGLEAFGITAQELALICASHSGTRAHLEVLKGLQDKIGVAEDDLACGSHLPYHKPTRHQMRCMGEEPTQNHHNCSGKHTGMLALARLLQAPLQGYTEPDHPVQQTIQQAVSEMCDIRADDMLIARDGCSVVTFGMPLQQAALGWARLSAPEKLPSERSQACRKITQSLQEHPEMVGGPDRFDTDLMHVSGGRIIAKAGAEAFQSLGIPPGISSRFPGGAGIALKIADGDRGKTARSAVALEVLKQLQVLEEHHLQALAHYGPVLPLHNQRGLLVGEGHPCFQLNTQDTNE